MNRFLSLRPTQSSMTAATSSTRVLRSASAPYRRAVLLGGLALLGSFGTAMAQDVSSVKAKQGDAESLWLTVENPTQQQVQVEVVCQAHATRLLNEVNTLPSYGTHLNFRGLPAGQYVVRLRVGRERYRYNVQVQEQGQPQTTISVRELTPAKTPNVVALVAR